MPDLQHKAVEKAKRIFPLTATNKKQTITYNVIKRSVRVTNAVVETKKYYTF